VAGIARQATTSLSFSVSNRACKTTRLERINFGLAIFAAVVGVLSLIGLPLSIYLWLWAKDDYCEVHGRDKYLGVVCAYAPPKPTPPNLDGIKH
jgi:hypothetical protein